jgi:hypothetical protein
MQDRAGRVVAYDAERGLGTVEAGDGERFSFHCTSLSERGPDPAVGAGVVFRVVPGQRGRWEADALRACSA